MSHAKSSLIILKNTSFKIRNFFEGLDTRESDTMWNIMRMANAPETKLKKLNNRKIGENRFSESNRKNKTEFNFFFLKSRNGQKIAKKNKTYIKLKNK